MSPKIAIYGTGQYALEAIRIIVDKDWEIVTAYNRADTKVGQDLGALASLPSPLGALSLRTARQPIEAFRMPGYLYAGRMELIRKAV